MKQHITTEQMNELSPEARERLNEWFWNKQGVISFHHYKENGKMLLKAVPARESTVNPEFITIGQMIEFLTPQYVSSRMHDGTLNPSIYLDENFCDALWEAVKEALKTKTPTV